MLLIKAVISSQRPCLLKKGGIQEQRVDSCYKKPSTRVYKKKLLLFITRNGLGNHQKTVHSICFTLHWYSVFFSVAFFFKEKNLKLAKKKKGGVKIRVS